MNETLMLSPVIPLQVVVLNSNERRNISLHSLTSSNLLGLRAAVSAGATKFNLPFGVCDWRVDFRDGNAHSNLWLGSLPVATAGIATSPLGADELWQFLIDLHDERMRHARSVPRNETLALPKQTPWLGLGIAPAFAAAATARQLRMVQALHWLMAWAVVEHVAVLKQRN